MTSGYDVHQTLHLDRPSVRSSHVCPGTDFSKKDKAFHLNVTCFATPSSTISLDVPSILFDGAERFLNVPPSHLRTSSLLIFDFPTVNCDRLDTE